MRTVDQKLAQQLTNNLIKFDQDKHHLPGIRNPIALTVYVEQLLESIHRVNYVSLLKKRKLDERCVNPDDELFDPIKAAIVHSNKGNLDEAFWLTFLLTHFGKHRIAGWQYLKDIYGQQGSGRLWSWKRICKNTDSFRTWLSENQDLIKGKNPRHGFGNHRKYQSLDAYSAKGTGSTIVSYVHWIGESHQHRDIFELATKEASGNPKKAFHLLYKSMSQVIGFGRTGRFDYLTMVGHLGLAEIEPGLAYLQNSTGPIKGAKLLFTGSVNRRVNASELEVLLSELNNDLGVGMQALEDSLCNWQKSPERFIKFRG